MSVVSDLIKLAMIRLSL